MGEGESNNYQADVDQRICNMLEGRLAGVGPKISAEEDAVGEYRCASVCVVSTIKPSRNDKTMIICNMCTFDTRR